jgi:hypothetical protein
VSNALLKQNWKSQTKERSMINRREFVSGLAGAGIVLATGNLVNSKNVRNIPLYDPQLSTNSNIEVIRKRYQKPAGVLDCFTHVKVKPEDIVRTTHFDSVAFPLGFYHEGNRLYSKKNVPILTHRLPDVTWDENGFIAYVPLYENPTPFGDQPAIDALDLIKAAGNHLVSKVEFPIKDVNRDKYSCYNKVRNLLLSKRRWSATRTQTDPKRHYSHILCNIAHQLAPIRFLKTDAYVIGLEEIDENTIYLTTKSELIYLTEGRRIGFACLDENSIETIHFSK